MHGALSNDLLALDPEVKDAPYHDGWYHFAICFYTQALIYVSPSRLELESDQHDDIIWSGTRQRRHSAYSDEALKGGVTRAHCRRRRRCSLVCPGHLVGLRDKYTAVRKIVDWWCGLKFDVQSDDWTLFITGDLNGTGCSAPFSAEPGSLEHLSMFGAVFGQGCRSPWTFLESWRWRLVIHCNGNNLQLGTPFMEQPDYHQQYWRYTMTCHGNVWYSPHWNLFKIEIKKYLKLNHLVSRSTETNTIDWTKKRFHNALLWRNGVTFLWKERERLGRQQRTHWSKKHYWRGKQIIPFNWLLVYTSFRMIS